MGVSEVRPDDEEMYGGSEVSRLPRAGCHSGGLQQQEQQVLDF